MSRSQIYTVLLMVIFVSTLVAPNFASFLVIAECLESLKSTYGCDQELLASQFTGQVDAIRPACCRAFLIADDNCWPKIFASNPFFPATLKDYCLRITNVYWVLCATYSNAKSISMEIKWWMAHFVLLCSRMHIYFFLYICKCYMVTRGSRPQGEGDGKRNSCGSILCVGWVYYHPIYMHIWNLMFGKEKKKNERTKLEKTTLKVN